MLLALAVWVCVCTVCIALLARQFSCKLTPIIKAPLSFQYHLLMSEYNNYYNLMFWQNTLIANLPRYIHEATLKLIA